MKKNILATSIAEAMVVMLVILIGVTGSYQMFSQSIKAVDSSEFKIQAISMAREAIEAVNNIRDTNWILFKWDLPNCWNTLNYDTRCFNDPTTTYDITPGSYRVDNLSGQYRWTLYEYTGAWDYQDTTYRNFFWLWLDSNWFYTHQQPFATEIKPPFTREIIISYLDDWENPVNSWTNISNEQKMKVTAKVQWMDTGSNTVRKVEMSNILTNWENKKVN